MYDAADVVGELDFWVSIAASKDVRVSPVDENSLIEPRGAETEDDDDEEVCVCVCVKMCGKP